MKKVISASRRSDVVAFFPVWLSQSLQREKAMVFGPSGHKYSVDLSPENVHTLVLWSKDFLNLIKNRHRLLENIKKYDQIYLHFTITGLGGTFIEKKSPPPEDAVRQLSELINIAGSPARISVRFDPVVYWKEEGSSRSNIQFFEELAPEISSNGIKDVRFSFVQWYGKAKRRALKHNFQYRDPSEEEKIEAAHYLTDIALKWGLNLYACSQNFLTVVKGINPSSCIDGVLLQKLHPKNEAVSLKKDKSQRKECLCTESMDIGSYKQTCPHACLYCYANPSLDDS
jgi:DNA repair photolyase